MNSAKHRKAYKSKTVVFINKMHLAMAGEEQSIIIIHNDNFSQHFCILAELRCFDKKSLLCT